MFFPARIAFFVVAIALLVQTPAKPRLFLGEPPQHGAAVNPPPKKIADSYRDMRGHWTRDEKIGAAFELTDKPAEADVVLTIVRRGEVVDGAAYAGRAVAGSYAVPGTRYSLRAELSVPGTDVVTTLDEIGGEFTTWKDLAGIVLRRAAEWVTTNREALIKRRPER